MPAPQHIPSLDGIRAASFLVVFLSHAAPSWGLPGQFGVTVFFFLSGYLITTLLRVEHQQTGRVALRAFYLRRSLRIFPPFYLTLTVATALAALGILPSAYVADGVAAIALHVANYYAIVARGFAGMPPGTDVFWSLAVEEHFYLLFPLLYLWSTPSGALRQSRLFLALCILALLWRCILVFAYESPPSRTFIATDTRVDSLLFGCLLAVRGNPVLDPWRGSRELFLRVLVPISLAVLLVCFALGGWLRFRETIRYTLQGIALVPIFIAVIRYPDALAFRWLNHPWVRYVGVRSYSLYLLHGVAIACAKALKLPLGSPQLIVVSLALVVVTAEIIWVTVERPCARLRQRLRSTPAVRGPATV
jgi:peptidoglycan/LPS O-acetylase OafA/YrhL